MRIEGWTAFRGIFVSSFRYGLLVLALVASIAEAESGKDVLREPPPVVVNGCQTEKQGCSLSPATISLPAEAPTVSEVCKDNCGNGVCEEIVCLALGCPCPESSSSCPQDCPPGEALK